MVSNVAAEGFWPHPGELADLLDELRNAGFRIGLNHYALSQNLIVSLIASGEEISLPGRLKDYLGPVLCSTAQEQELFAKYLDRWLSARRPHDASPSDAMAYPPPVMHSIPRNRTWTLAGAGVIAAADLTFLWQFAIAIIGLRSGWLLARVGRQAGRTPTADLISLSISIAVVLLGWLVWRLRGALLLRRQPSVEEAQAFSPNIGISELSDRKVLHRAARELRRRRKVDSREIDVRGTVEATVRQLGFYTPVFRVRYAYPEYLALVERRHLRDLNAQYMDEMIATLRREGVIIDQLYFEQEPKFLYTTGDQGRPISLRRATELYGERRVLVFTDAATFFSPLSGELSRWSDNFRKFSDVAVFSPRPIESWGYQERVLATFATVLPQKPEALLWFAQKINHQRADGPFRGEVTPPMPSDLLQNPDYWLGQEEPEAEEVSTLMASLRRYLGDNGFLWLAACAVYPDTSLDLVTYLGNTLKGADGQSLFDGGILGRLLRLPWLQQGGIPNWLRMRLIQSLSPARANQVREALATLLLATGGIERPFDLAIETKAHHIWLRVLRRMTSARRSAVDQPIRDQIFFRIMAANQLKGQAFHILRLWRSLREAHKDVWETMTSGIRPPRTSGEIASCTIGLLVAAGITIGLSDGNPRAEFTGVIVQIGVTLVVVLAVLMCIAYRNIRFFAEFAASIQRPLFPLLVMHTIAGAIYLFRVLQLPVGAAHTVEIAITVTWLMAAVGLTILTWRDSAESDEGVDGILAEIE